MLEITDLQVRYGRVVAVAGFTAEVEPGKVTLVLGANGAGKTSTLRAVAGSLTPHAGRVVVDGVDITGKPAHRVVRQHVALVPEGRQVFAPLTVAENLRLGGMTVSGKEREATMETVYELFPILRTRRSSAAGYLSGGEQQMLALGRALMSSPRYVLLDEPSMGLSPQLVDTVVEQVGRIAQAGTGVLMVEQNADAGLRVADRVILMERGTITYSGSVADAHAERALASTFLGDASKTPR
jgi:branched-chain amino acid transport system ATP-binding protein